MSERWHDWFLLPQRIALHEATATAVIADVHLGYAQARRRLGDAIPLRRVRDELAPLSIAAKMHDIRHLIIAGDLFERGYDAEVCAEFFAVLAEWRITCIGVVPGNHDRGIDKAAPSLIVLTDPFDLAGWRITHGDGTITGDCIIQGHEHLATRIACRKVPCFLTRGTHLVLPAFSRDAAGVSVDGSERWIGWVRHAIGDVK